MIRVVHDRDRRSGAAARDRPRREPIVLFALVVAGLAVSGWSPQSRVTWILEVAPLLIGVPILVATYRRFPLTPLAYRLAFALAALLLIGGHYTFTHVPAGIEFRKILGLRRNDFDRFVHFAGGFVPAILGRELVRRKLHLARRGWLFFIVAAGCLAGAAAYELVEWAAAEIMHGSAREFLATQGDRWDTQWDMFSTFLGAVTSLLLLSRVHERELEALR
jgi:putative membrane protein